MKTKVSDLKYERYTLESAENAYKAFENRAINASSAAEILEAREKFLQEYKHFNTAYSLANCRFTLNTRDEFYSSEMEYYDEISPEISNLMLKYSEIMLDSPYRSELEKHINPQIYKRFEVQRKSFSPLIIEDSKKENALTTEYSKFMSEMEFEFDGKKMPLSVLRGFLSNTDREIRKKACIAIGEGLSRNSAELDRIFDELVKLRDSMAKKMGYSDFVELGYYRMGRVDYDRKMVESFRKNVLSDLVPVVSNIKGAIKEELGYDELMFYDNDTYSAEEAPDPIVDTDGIFRAAVEMYDEMSTTTGKFMRSMLEAEAFDVESRDGKWGGGYCTAFPDYKQPFILANFNGTSADLDVITHEFGHALAYDYLFRKGDEEADIGGMETAECHSMSMEFFAWPYMEKFLGNKAELYRRKHMLDALSFIPYGVIVDEFQHVIYSNPSLTPEERKAVYLKLEEKYRPYMSYSGIPYLEEGTRWQYQMHIYESPFYYIDYCLAQTVAFGFLVESRKDYEGALQKYLRFVSRGGTASFDSLIKEAGLNSPFENGALKNMSFEILEIEKSFKK